MRGNFWGDGPVGRRGVVHTVDTTGRMAAIRAHTPRVCAARCGGVTRVGRREIREARAPNPYQVRSMIEDYIAKGPNFLMMP